MYIYLLNICVILGYDEVDLCPLQSQFFFFFFHLHNPISSLKKSGGTPHARDSKLLAELRANRDAYFNFLSHGSSQILLLLAALSIYKPYTERTQSPVQKKQFV
jgi:hypothetical protein